MGDLARVTRWLPVAVWMGVIFLFSSFPDLSLEKILPVLGWTWGPGGRVAEIDLLLRKMGHLAEYAVLATLFFRALAGEKDWRLSRSPYSAAFFFSVFYSLTDEAHQYFVPGRTASGVDVFVDSFGVALGLLVVALRQGEAWYGKGGGRGCL